VRRAGLLLLLPALVPLRAAGNHDLLRVYARDFDSVRVAVTVLAEAVRDRYPETFFATDAAGEAVAEVSPVPGVGLIRFDYAALDSAADRIENALAPFIPDYNPFLKTLRRGGTPLNDTGFQLLDADFKYRVRWLVRIGAAIAKMDPAFPHAGMTDEFDVPHWREWYDVTREIVRKGSENYLADFGTRFGPGADKVNWFELWLTNWLPPFTGGPAGPSRWEPIVRFTPLCYDITGTRLSPVVQLGINGYFLGRPGLLFETLNHCGLAVVASHAELHRGWRRDNLSFGLMFHVRTYQVGITRGIDGNWNVLSTVDFQLVPALF